MTNLPSGYKEIFDSYFEYVSTTRLSNELYKWRLLKANKGFPDVQSKDLFKELSVSKYDNLVFAQAYSVMRHLSKNYTELYRDALSTLFDLQTEIRERIENFSRQMNDIWLLAHSERRLSHHHDERTMATMLAFKFPEEFPLFKDTFYRKFCSFLGVKQEIPGKKYLHYLELIKEFNQALRERHDIIELVNSLKTSDCYEDPNLWLLSQDILFQYFDSIPAQEAVIGLMVADKTDWKAENIALSAASEYSILWNSKSPTGTNVTIKKLRERIDEGEAFKLFYSEEGVVKYLAEVVDFAVNDKDYRERNWNSDYPDAFNIHPSFEAYKSGTKAARILFLTTGLKAIEPIPVKDFTFFNGAKAPVQDNMSPVQAYAGAVSIIGGQNVQTVMDPLSLNTIFYGPPGTGKTFKMLELKLAQFTDKVFQVTEAEQRIALVASYPMWKILAAVLYYAEKPLSVNEIFELQLVKAKVNPNAKTPKDSIWTVLQTFADENSSNINEKYKADRKLFSKSLDSKWSLIKVNEAEIQDILDAELMNAANPKGDNRNMPKVHTKRERFEFVTFHQKYGYEDFIEGIKPVLADGEKTEGSLQFMLQKGIFYKACLKALELVGYGSFEECYRDSSENRQAKFTAAQADPTKHFALFIDEINRANISAVFGELITLLEDDKRAGANHEMWVKLPASGEMFSVPLNLYVIGTMNTADRSIALLDIALRRRFHFEGLYPKYDFDKWWGAPLKKLNEAIKEKKGNADLFIGHAFFINKSENEYVTTLNRKIIPLLNEYCQNNQKQVQEILDAAKIEYHAPAIENNYQIIAK